MSFRPDRLPQGLRLAAYAAAVAVLLYLTLAPGDALPPQATWDKAQHALSWCVLGGIGLAFWPRRPIRVAAFALGLGVVVEVLQAALPFGRHGDVRDLVGDGAGMAAALAVWAMARRLGMLRAA